MDVKIRGANEIKTVANIETCRQPSEPIKYF